MGLNNALSQYQNVNNQEALNGASPHRLIQMLMEGALRRLAEAKGAIQRGDITAKGEALGKSAAIIGGLRDSLDMDASTDIAQNLDDLYEYMVYTIVQANLHSDESKIDEVVGLMKTIKEGWDGIEGQV